MSRVKSSGNKATELALIALLRRHHVSGWRRHVRIFGNPDFVFPKQRLAIFVDGCFWHGCPRHATQPLTNGIFWKTKLTRNKRRDQFVTRALRKLGWRVVRVWQHELLRKNERLLVSRIRRARALV